MVIAVMETDVGGTDDIILRDASMRYKGRYHANTNVTRDYKGSYVGQGNLLGTLIHTTT